MTDRNRVRDEWKAMWAETIDLHGADEDTVDWLELENDLISDSEVAAAVQHVIEDAQESLQQWIMGALDVVRAEVTLILLSETEALDDDAAARVGQGCQPAMRDVCRTAGDIITRAGEKMVERSGGAEQYGETVTFKLGIWGQDAWEMPTVGPGASLWTSLEALRMTARDMANREKIDALLGARLDALWPPLRAKLMQRSPERALISSAYWVDRFQEFADSVPDLAPAPAPAPEGDSL